MYSGLVYVPFLGRMRFHKNGNIRHGFLKNALT